MRRLIFLEQTARILFHAVLVGSLFLLFAGHNEPGGGFAGGLVAGAAISLRYLSGGIADVRRISRLAPWTILGSGVALAAATALAPMLAGRPVMTALGASLHPPLLGDVRVATTLAFDVGVYLVVLGLVFMVFEAFADDSATAADLAGIHDDAGDGDDTGESDDTGDGIRDVERGVRP